GLIVKLCKTSGLSLAMRSRNRKRKRSSAKGFKLLLCRGTSSHRKPSSAKNGEYLPRGETRTTSCPAATSELASAARKLNRYQSVLAKSSTFNSHSLGSS